MTNTGRAHTPTTVRCIRLALALLEAPATVASLRRTLGCSKATLYRDLETLRRAGLALHTWYDGPTAWWGATIPTAGGSPGE